MSWLKTLLGCLVSCLLATALRAQTTAPADPGPLAITATPDPATVQPGDALKFNVSIKNISQTEQTIDVPNIVWAAATDVPQITIPGWPARGGIGPVVVFKSTAIAPGESYPHTWTANVAATAQPGDLTLRVGVPLKRGGDKTWSSPLTLKVAAKDAAQETPNPLYTAWKGQVAKSATYTRTMQISGGAPVPGGAAAPTTLPLMIVLKELTPDHAAVSFDFMRNALPETLTIPATLPPDDPALPKPAGKEDLKIGAKTYACTKYTYTSNSKAEIGLDPQGLPARVTVWLADGVPGGIVKRQISLTIRASYDITDTLSDK